MALNWKDIIAKSNMTAEEKATAEKVFGTESLTTAIEEAAMHTANAAFEADRNKMQQQWDTANAEYVRMQNDTSATAAELTKAKADLAEATEKLKRAGEVDFTKVTDALRTELTDHVNKMQLGRGAYEVDAIECVAAHRELFGQTLSVRQLIEDALAAKKPVQAYWEEHYKVGEKRSEIAKAAHDREIEAAKNEGYAKRVAEEANPATRPLTESKNPFWVPKQGATNEGVNPWDATDAPPEEQALLRELTAARAA